MNKTLITLLALSGMASAATATRIYPDIPYTIPSDGTEYQLNFDATDAEDPSFVVSTSGAVKVSKTDAYSSSNMEGATVTLTLGGTMTVSDTWGNNFKNSMTLNYNFGEVGKIDSVKFGLGGNATTVNITTVTTLSQLEGVTDDLYSRLLIDNDGFIWNSNGTAEAGKWSITDAGLTTLGYSSAGVLSYRDGSYYDVTTGNEVVLGEMQYALVLDGLTYGVDTGCKTVRLVATPAVPEPTTATLSLLALAGLAARRRRK